MADIRSNLDAKSRVYGTEEALAQIFVQLLAPQDDNLQTVSDVTPQEIFGLSVLSAYASIFDSKLMKDWMGNFLRLRVSRMRIGRKELILLGSGIREYLDNKSKGKGRFSDLFSGL
jgi:hypothetical protein